MNEFVFAPSYRDLSEYEAVLNMK